jgi:hypothetical protein
MGNLEVLVIPLIALAVYVLGSLLGGKAEPPPNRRRPLPRDREGAPGRPQGRTTDLDRFLEEVQRRREQVQQKAKEAKPEEFTASAERPPRPTPPPPPVRKPAPRVSQARPSPRPKSPVEDIPVVIALEGSRPPAQVRPVVAPTPARVEAPPVAPPAVAVALAVAPVVSQVGAKLLDTRPSVPITGTAQQVVSLLRSPQSLAVAVMLREILDAPVSLRRSGRHRA